MTRPRPNDFMFPESAGKRDSKLKSLTLRNFKSIIDQQINFAPLTIIVGKNSSGKSTLLQSILLLAQNASNPLRKNQAHEGKLDLNGDLVSLGVFREAKNDRSMPEDLIGIGGEFEFSYQQNMEFQPNIGKDKGDSPQSFGKRATLKWDMNLGGVDSLDASIVESISSHGSLLFENQEVQNFVSRNSGEERIDDLMTAFDEVVTEDVPDIWSGVNFFREAEIDSFARLQGYSERPGASMRTYFAELEPSTKFFGVKHVLGLPVNGLKYVSRYTFFLIRQNEFFNGNMLRFKANSILSQAQRRNSIYESDIKKNSSLMARNEMFTTEEEAHLAYLQKAEDFITNESEWLTSREFDISVRPLLPVESIPFILRAAIKEEYRDGKLPLELQDCTIGTDGWLEFKLTRLNSLVGFLEFDRADLSYQIMESSRKFWKNLEDQLFEKFSNFDGNGIVEVLVPASMSDNFSNENEGLNSEEFEFGDAVTRLSEFFEDLVYLGPLRLEPSDIYKRSMGTRSSQLPLGMQGEELARVVFENPTGKYPLPPDSTLSASSMGTTFTDALNAWLKWLGIAKSGISVTPDRHYGFRLTVDGRYLRSLGVGVSQVIPVVGVCLLANAGSLVLLEEPELHLNPNIQQKLADFFLAMTNSGRQLIVETHSEYLITRLRLRAMQDNANREIFNFIFTEQEHENWNSVSAKSPYSIYREVRPSADGQLPEWPAGFFDQVTTDVQALLDELIKRDESEK
jgi:predicted ATPase